MTTKRLLPVSIRKRTAPYNTRTLERFFDNDVSSSLTFSHDIWLPELHAGLSELAGAVGREDASAVRFITHRLRGCALMGGANEIVRDMRELDTCSNQGQWLRARGCLRDVGHLVQNITAWVDSQYDHLAS